MVRAFFVSDVHLNNMDERNSQTLLRFFHTLREQKATHLFLVGDIFDLWIGKHEYFIHKYKPFVDAIHDLVTSGIEVHYFEGNHDLYLKEFWEDVVGAHVHVGAEYFRLGEHTIRVEHGDLINPNDRGYLFLRSFLRMHPMTWLARHLPANAISAIGERASRASRQYTSTAKELPATEIRTLIRTHAETAFYERPYDMIISGHVHVDDDHCLDLGGRVVRSVNLGSWFDRPHVLQLEAEPLTYRFIPL